MSLYNHHGNAIKRMLAARMKWIEGACMPGAMTIMNLITNHLSNMAVLEIYTGIEIDSEVLTQHTLTADVVFRETHHGPSTTKLTDVTKRNYIPKLHLAQSSNPVK